MSSEKLFVGLYAFVKHVQDDHIEFWQNPDVVFTAIVLEANVLPGPGRAGRWTLAKMGEF